MRAVYAASKVRIKLSSRPKPTSSVRSTSRVTRGSPHRITAIPPMTQDFHPRLSHRTWSSRATSRTSFMSRTEFGEIPLHVDHPGGWADRQARGIIKAAFQRLDCSQIVCFLNFALADGLQRRPGLFPDRDPAAHLLTLIH